uniref:V-type proton ATPase subunit G n=1 Tax=Peromyscus maniculatus bairdii TaxID=230844 RepID=A0A8C8URQ6_PERMB
KASQLRVSWGIQQLLDAKKRAAEKVLKQAKGEREEEVKAKEAASLGSHGSCSSEMERETQEKMTVLQNYC